VLGKRTENVTRVAWSREQLYRMETCDTEEPYEGKPHVRFCGEVGRAIADLTRIVKSNVTVGIRGWLLR